MELHYIKSTRVVNTLWLEIFDTSTFIQNPVCVHALFISLSACLSVCLPVCLPVCLSVCVHMHQTVTRFPIQHLSSHLLLHRAEQHHISNKSPWKPWATAMMPNNNKVLMCDFSAKNLCGGRAVSQPLLPAVHTESNRDEVRAQLKTQTKTANYKREGRRLVVVRVKWWIISQQTAKKVDDYGALIEKMEGLWNMSRCPWDRP